MKCMHAAKLAIVAVASLFLGACAHSGAKSRAPIDAEALRLVVDAAVRPVMDRHAVPGMAVAVTVDGRPFFFNYGVAARDSGKPVTERTLFEIGSLSKTFTATLAAYARETGTLSFSDKAGAHLPALAGTVFDRIALLDLGTYTAGGLPLQFPDAVTDDATMVAFYRGWRPAFEPGTRRVYSNPSIGLFGHLAARSMGAPFVDVMEGRLFPMLGLTDTWLRVPPARMADYAWGYNRDLAPVRVSPGVLDAQAYGVKTHAADMLRFVEANMGGAARDPALQRALAATHVGYFQVGGMTQALGWETYAWPASLDVLQAGNSTAMALEAQPATRLGPPRPPRGDVLVNKTGSTNGFGAYAAFVPARRIGVVLLANRNYPNADRVQVAYRILQALDGR